MFSPELSELISRTHREMSGSKPVDEQFDNDEQTEMRLLCEVYTSGDDAELDREQTERNFVELIHYLVYRGVLVPQISGKIRCFGDETKKISKIIGFAQARERRGKMTPVSAGADDHVKTDLRPLFMAPPESQFTAAGAVA